MVSFPLLTAMMRGFWIASTQAAYSDYNKFTRAMRRRLAIIFLVCCVLGATPQDSRRVVPVVGRQIPRRVALIIGNAAYRSVSLVNPLNDARAVAAQLKEFAFFEVTEVEDIGLQAMEQAVDRFIESLREGDTALFYYSGHGMQIEGENYLVPVDFSAKDEGDAKYEALSAQRVHDRMAGAGAALSILILDACRDNPFRGTRGGARGWAPMQTGKGSLIAFATAPGATAADNAKDRNGLYTKYLLESLGKPGLRINDVFAETTEAVYKASEGKQAPWVAMSVVGNFVFRDPALEEQVAEGKLKRLEEELNAAEKALEQAQAGQAKREALQAEQAAQAKLELQRLEQERLGKEAARERELEAEREKLETDQEARLQKREKQREETEARLAELRRSQARVQAGIADMTVGDARAKVVELTEKLAEIRKPVDAAEAAALKKLLDDYAPLRERAVQAAAKDEFETTAEYQARLEPVRKQRQALEDRYNGERTAIEKQFASELELASVEVVGEIHELRARTYTQTALVEWDGYNADLQTLTVHTGLFKHRFAVPPAEARQLAQRKDRLVLQTEVALKADTGSGDHDTGEYAEGWHTEAALEADTGSPKTAYLVDTSTGWRFEAAALSAGEKKVNQKDGLTYVWIPPGRFMMGCSTGDSDCYDDEKPAHQVTITKGFWLGQTEVTQAAYQHVTVGNPSLFKGKYLPVDSITWDEAKGYCESVGMRLPTEAQWEYAARSGSGPARYGELNDIAWYSSNSDKPHEVGQKTPNDYGLYDMLGNVWEWVADWHGGYQANDKIDPQGPATGQSRIVRGGSWYNRPSDVRVSVRNVLVAPDARSYHFGVRCAGNWFP